MGLPANAFAELVGVGGGHALDLERGALLRACLPDAGEKCGAEDGGKEEGDGHDPGDVVEAAAERRGEDGRTVLLNEPVEDLLVRATRGELLVEFVDHAGGVGAADVVAFEEYLAAAAGAHHVVADPLVAFGGGVSSAQHDHGEAADEDGLKEAGGWPEPAQTQIPFGNDKQKGKSASASL